MSGRAGGVPPARRESLAKPTSYAAAAIIALAWVVLLGWWAYGFF
jgi:hypothetical protein